MECTGTWYGFFWVFSWLTICLTWLLNLIILPNRGCRATRFGCKPNQNYILAMKSILTPYGWWGKAVDVVELWNEGCCVWVQRRVERNRKLFKSHDRGWHLGGGHGVLVEKAFQFLRGHEKKSAFFYGIFLVFFAFSHSHTAFTYTQPSLTPSLHSTHHPS